MPVSFHQFRVRVQQCVTKVGAHLTTAQIQKLNSTLNYLEVGRWLKANGFSSSPRYADRWELYAAIAKDIKQDKILYLEFGVYEGYTLKRWAKLLHNPRSRFCGFDSFQGLPEDWDSLRPKGTFHVMGAIPLYDDPRVTLHKGWFNETLPTFVLPEHDRLLLHLDADLYSSTIYVLEMLHERMGPGTIIIFDQFCDRFHELKAWSEFLKKRRLKFGFLGATLNLEQVAFRCTGV